MRQLAGNNPEVFYYEITDDDFEEELFQKFLKAVFIDSGYHPVTWHMRSKINLNGKKA